MNLSVWIAGDTVNHIAVSRTLALCSQLGSGLDLMVGLRLIFIQKRNVGISNSSVKPFIGIEDCFVSAAGRGSAYNIAACFEVVVTPHIVIHFLVQTSG